MHIHLIAPSQWQKPTNKHISIQRKQQLQQQLHARTSRREWDNKQSNQRHNHSKEQNNYK